MPLDYTNGEQIGELGHKYVVVPVDKWIESPLWEEAVDNAAAAFKKSGALLPIKIPKESVLCQEYHETGLIVFVFPRDIGGKELFHPVVTQLEPETQAHYASIQMWPSKDKRERLN